MKFPAAIRIQEERAEAKGSVTLDRSLWDIRYRSGKFFPGVGDKMIFDEFAIEMAVIESRLGSRETRITKLENPSLK